MNIVNSITVFSCGTDAPSPNKFPEEEILQKNVEIARLLGRDVHVLDGRLIELRDGKLVAGPNFFEDITAYDGADIFEDGIPYIKAVQKARSASKWICFFPWRGQWYRTGECVIRTHTIARAALFALRYQSAVT